MKLFYFPLTRVSRQDRDILGLFFQKLFYISSDTWHGAPGGPCRKETLSPYGKKESPEETPDQENTLELMPLGFPQAMREQVMGSLGDYQQWARHSGAGPGQLKSLLRKTPYFTSDTHVGAIRSQIKKGGHPETFREDPSQDLVKALVFLCLAGEHDEQKASIDAALSSVDEKKHRLFSTLAGDVPMASSEKIPGKDAVNLDFSVSGTSGDPGAVMTQSRLSSWFRVFQEVCPPVCDDDPCVFITASPGGLAFFEQICPGRLVLDSEDISGAPGGAVMGSHDFKEQIMARMTAVFSDLQGTCPVQAPGDETAHREKRSSRGFRLYFFKGSALKSFFCPHGEKGRSLLPLPWIERGIFVGFVGDWK
ncbi:hypothetical protein SAMN02746065_109103 [Desulfocicer vacuolatum DSM 3385]|uniref:Uncharacterized protein n=1 Tax=Desulfocicer vacuolatum DSM 3385 TaxID=1121400 RepID=A0A1W2BSR4_9BACT|nr:hypothetical protein [Desulfocicer vacuolatum]SMC76020.1 hypothetical protein SAMN02746065_109103 [Desulfocicer vacuolatum DSM 3385]